MPIEKPKRGPGQPSKGGRPRMAPGKRKASVSLYLWPATLAEIDEWLKGRPELTGRSAAVEWAWRVASRKGAKP